MKSLNRKEISRLARGLVIGWNLFLGMFALDVFEEQRWFLALIMHLIPNFILAIATVIAWRHERLGGILFIGVGLLMAGLFKSIIVSGPVVIIGGLFLTESYLKR